MNRTARLTILLSWDHPVHFDPDDRIGMLELQNLRLDRLKRQ